MDLKFTSVAEQAALVREGTVSARALTEFVLGEIERLNPVLNAFNLVLRADALAEADRRDAALAAGEVTGPLHGVPIAIKDEYDVAGTRTTFGTGAVTRSRATDSEIVRRLRAAGAVIVGKTLMPEFGIWPFTESTTYGVTRNPWHLDRSTSGSSGGTAAAVASGMVAAGIGGDGGGSIRLPASWCGLFGLKPQRGRVSMGPHARLWRSLGTAGPLTRTVVDSALIYDVISGSLPTDAYAAEPWSTSLTEALTRDPGSLRIRVVTDNPGGGPAPDAATLAAVRASAEALASHGHRVEEGPLPGYRPGLSFLAQVAAGVAEEVGHVDDPRRLEMRTRAAVRITRPLVGRADAAERAAERLAARVNRVFEEVDLILMATTPTAAVRIGQLDTPLPLLALKATRTASLTSPWNLLGNPAAAVPAGLTDDGLPLSVQLAGRPSSEPLLMQVAAQLETIRPWRDRRPPVS